MNFGRRFGELTVHPFAPNEGAAPAAHQVPQRRDQRAVRHRRLALRRDLPRRAADGDGPVRQGSAGNRRRHHVREHVGGLQRAERPDEGSSSPGSKRSTTSSRSARCSATARRTARTCSTSSCSIRRSVHPVVRVHPVSGRKVLFVNPQFTIAIKDMDERESRSLLDTLFHQALIPEYQFRHHWAPHTIAMWDNRSTQHYAVNDYYPQRRYMERVTIRGGPVTGRRARRSRRACARPRSWCPRTPTRRAATSRIARA